MQYFFNSFQRFFSSAFFPVTTAGFTCLILSACGNKDGNCTEETSNTLRPGITTAIPWQNGQTFKFKTNESDEFSVNVTKIYKTPAADNNCEEYLEIKLTDPKNTYPFVASVQRGLATDSMIQITVSPRRKNGTGTTVQFYLTQNQQLAGFNTGSYQATNLFSVVIDGKTYQDVLKLDYISPPDDDGILQFFYNKTFGIIQLRTKKGLIVTRIE